MACGSKGNDLFQECFDSSQFASDLFIRPDHSVEIEICDATPQHDLHVIDVNYIKIGDAAFTIDPISSQGVQKAIKSAVQGAIIVNSMLNHDTISLAIRFYEERVKLEVKNNQLWAVSYYSEQGRYSSNFWRARSAIKPKQVNHTSIRLSAKDQLILNPKGSFDMTPILEKDRLSEIEAFVLPSDLEPIIYVESVYFPPILKKIDGGSLKQVLQILAGAISSKPPVEIMEWLIWNEVLVSKGQLE